LRLYIDSNALVHLYADENPVFAQRTRDAISQATTLTTSAITYPEVRAAFKSLKHNKRITHREYVTAVADFKRDWPKIEAFDVNDTISNAAGELADQYILKGCDAVHVATAVALHFAHKDVQLLTFDFQLEKRVLASGLVPIWKPNASDA
jgi:uncharacterized protein